MAKKTKVLNEPESGIVVHLAIISHLKPHRLAFKINEVCGWRLKRLRNLLSHGISDDKGFALYFHEPEKAGLEYYLLSLKNEKELLLQALKNFDYLVQIRVLEKDPSWNTKGLLQELNSVEGILGVFDINAEKLKNANVLYFDTQLDHLLLEEKKKDARTKKVN